jgi:hypothetical protein
MGCCLSSKRSAAVPVERRRFNLPEPSIYIEENFKLLDFSHKIPQMKAFEALRLYLSEFKFGDIRCVRRENEGPEVHSSLLATAARNMPGELAEELWYFLRSLVIQYSPYGFCATIGENNLVVTSADMKEHFMELIYLPGVDGSGKGSIGDAVEWAYEHKDEKYMDPAVDKELNMGNRIFKFVVGMMNNKAG